MSYIGAVEDDEEFMWGAMTEMAGVFEQEEVDGFATTRAQGRKGEMEKKAVTAHQLAYQLESKIMDPEAPQHVLQQILDVEVPNIKV
ncbi:hypothetical protein AN958_06155 [Leucoagaricus sp. SymC.cos]|nr:hypothetical protein AN958_06155 [Leucoagaricus sp. SymC.cos]